MRAFDNTQSDMFMKAFGQSIQTSTGTSFTAIVEVSPFSIETGGGFVEGIEHFITMKTPEMVQIGLKINDEIIIDSITYEIYNIVDDLSGLVNLYFRTAEGKSFAEDY